MENSDQCPGFQVKRVKLTCEDKCYAGNSVPEYSEQEAKMLAERLRTKEESKAAREVLITWLNRGECKESNSKTFLFMLQQCLDYFHQLRFEQKKLVKETEANIKGINSHSSSIQSELHDIEKVFKRIGEICQNSTLNEEKITSTLKMQETSGEIIANILNPEKISSLNPKIILQTKMGSLTHELCVAKREIKEMTAESEKLKKQIIELNLKLEKRKREEKNKSVASADSQNDPSIEVAALIDHDQEIDIDGIYSCVDGKIQTNPAEVEKY